jgi:hypothetical protein
MVNKRKSRLIKLGLFIFIGLVNISVYCIWIPALLGSNQSFIKLNHIWERVEKTIFLLVDFGLNLYFLYLVRSRLITQGLTKYWPLFNFNAAIVVVSASMDVLLLGLQNLPNSYEYVFFFLNFFPEIFCILFTNSLIRQSLQQSKIQALILTH